jgi:hypothetical protein
VQCLICYFYSICFSFTQNFVDILSSLYVMHLRLILDATRVCVAGSSCCFHVSIFLDQNLHHCMDHDTDIHSIKLIEIYSNYGFLCFMKLAPVDMEFCFFSLRLWISYQIGMLCRYHSS